MLPRMMTRLLLTAFALFPVLAHAQAITDAETAAVGKRFAAEIKCDTKDLNRAWCAVPKAGSQAFEAPATVTTYLGLSTEVPDGAGIVDALLKTTSVSALHLGPTTARLTSLKPSNEDEKKQMLPILMALANALKNGSKDPIAISADLGGYLDGERAKAGRALTVGPKGADYMAMLPSKLYRVGAVYVGVERSKGGHFVSVFPIVPLKR